MENKYLNKIDYLKAISIIMVLFVHSIYYANIFYGFKSLFSVIVYHLAYYSSMSFFFVISGYLTHKQDKKTYIKKRVLRLIVPYIFFSLVKLTYSIFINNAYAHGNTILSQLYDAFINGGLYWFAYTLFIVNIIGSFIWVDEDNNKLIGDTKKIKIILIVSILINILLSLLNINLGTNTYNIPFQLTKVFYYLPFYLIGYLLKDKDLLSKLTNIKKILIPVSLVIISLLLVFKTMININMNYIYVLCFGLSVMYLINLIVYKTKGTNKFLLAVGKYSWQIHFLDPFVKILLFMVVGSVGVINNGSIILIVLSDVFICVFISIIVDIIPKGRVLFGL